VAPQANHGANISRLAPADAAAATATLLRWAGLPAASAAPPSARTRSSAIPDDDMIRDRRTGR
jgi:hypothetical protein